MIERQAAKTVGEPSLPAYLRAGCLLLASLVPASSCSDDTPRSPQAEGDSATSSGAPTSSSTVADTTGGRIEEGTTTTTGRTDETDSQAETDTGEGELSCDVELPDCFRSLVRLDSGTGSGPILVDDDRVYWQLGSTVSTWLEGEVVEDLATNANSFDLSEGRLWIATDAGVDTIDTVSGEVSTVLDSGPYVSIAATDTGVALSDGPRLWSWDMSGAPELVYEGGNLRMRSVGLEALYFVDVERYDAVRLDIASGEASVVWSAPAEHLHLPGSMLERDSGVYLTDENQVLLISETGESEVVYAGAPSQRLGAMTKIGDELLVRDAASEVFADGSVLVSIELSTQEARTHSVWPLRNVARLALSGETLLMSDFESGVAGIPGTSAVGDGIYAVSACGCNHSG